MLSQSCRGAYNSSNAAQCTVPDCAIIVDPRCVECEVVPQQRLDRRTNHRRRTDVLYLDFSKKSSNLFVNLMVTRCLKCEPGFFVDTAIDRQGISVPELAPLKGHLRSRLLFERPKKRHVGNCEELLVTSSKKAPSSDARSP